MGSTYTSKLVHFPKTFLSQTLTHFSGAQRILAVRLPILPSHFHENIWPFIPGQCLIRTQAVIKTAQPPQLRLDCRSSLHAAFLRGQHFCQKQIQFNSSHSMGAYCCWLCTCTPFFYHQALQHNFFCFALYLSHEHLHTTVSTRDNRSSSRQDLSWVEDASVSTCLKVTFYTVGLGGVTFHRFYCRTEWCLHVTLQAKDCIEALGSYLS